MARQLGHVATGASAGFMAAADYTALYDSSARHLFGGTDALTTAAPVTVSTANSKGDAASFARSNHAHSYGDPAGETLHAAASGVAAGFMAAADFTALYDHSARHLPGRADGLTVAAPVAEGGLSWQALQDILREYCSNFHVCQVPRWTGGDQVKNYIRRLEPRFLKSSFFRYRILCTISVVTKEFNYARTF